MHHKLRDLIALIWPQPNTVYVFYRTFEYKHTACVRRTHVSLAKTQGLSAANVIFIILTILLEQSPVTNYNLQFPFNLYKTANCVTVTLAIKIS